jgi:putative hydrolase of HD superfamily
MTPDQLLDTVLGLDSLAFLPRTGWLLRGVRPAESIADHAFGVVIVTMLLTDMVRATGQRVDGERALRLAALHDVPEARTGDVPMPVKTPAFGRAIAEVEGGLADRLLGAEYGELWREADEKASLEARIVAAADKIHMMIKAFRYEQQGWTALDDFWRNPANFADMDLPAADSVFEALCQRAGRPRPG